MAVIKIALRKTIALKYTGTAGKYLFTTTNDNQFKHLPIHI